MASPTSQVGVHMHVCPKCRHIRHVYKMFQISIFIVDLLTINDYCNYCEPMKKGYGYW